MSRQSEYLYNNIDLADLRDAMEAMIHVEGLPFLVQQIAMCRATDGARIGLRGVREAVTDAMCESGQAAEDPHKDQCDQLRKAMRAFLELE